MKGRIMAPQRYPRPNLWNLAYVTLHGKEGIRVADGVKVANLMTLKKGNYLGFWCGSNVIKGSLDMEKGGSGGSQNDSI